MSTTIVYTSAPLGPLTKFEEYFGREQMLSTNLTNILTTLKN